MLGIEKSACRMENVCAWNRSRRFWKRVRSFGLRPAIGGSFTSGWGGLGSTFGGPSVSTAGNTGLSKTPRGVPAGRRCYLRVDTVHQGDDLGGSKGVYHINAVDEVAQWEVVAAAPQISEAWLIPALEATLAQFPFPIRGFHSDNGSEFVNHTVAKLFNKLLIEQTKSRPRRSNDNGLAEFKNGAVVRKHMGYLHIGARRSNDSMKNTSIRI